MKFEELQQEWQTAKRNEPRSHEEWKRMMYNPAPQKIKGVSWGELRKFLTTAFFFGLVIYLFDGLKTLPGWMLSAYWAYVFFDEFLGLRHINIAPQRDTLQESLAAALTRVRRGATVSKILHGILWLLVVYSLGATQTASLNMFWWALILLPMLVTVGWWSGRKWSGKIRDIEDLLEGLKDEPEIPFGSVA